MVNSRNIQYSYTISRVNSEQSRPYSIQGVGQKMRKLLTVCGQNFISGIDQARQSFLTCFMLLPSTTMGGGGGGGGAASHTTHSQYNFNRAEGSLLAKQIVLMLANHNYLFSISRS